METIIGLILVFITAFLLGFFQREIKELRSKVLEFIKKSEEANKKKSFVTMGAYRPPQETKQTAQIITPKRPQRIEVEANQRTLAENGLIDRSVMPK